MIRVGVFYSGIEIGIKVSGFLIYYRRADQSYQNPNQEKDFLCIPIHSEKGNENKKRGAIAPQLTLLQCLLFNHQSFDYLC